MKTRIRFTVTEPDGSPVDLDYIWSIEPWAVWCKAKGEFFIDEDGELGFVDACGSTSYPPEGRFVVKVSMEL